MQLKQLNKIDIEQFKRGSFSFDGLSAFNDSIPPIHVLERSLKLLEQGIHPIWALPYLIIHDQKIVGCCGFKSKPLLNAVEVGYNVASETRGQGLATLALRELCQVAFSNSVNSVKALISSQNMASRNVVMKNKFSFIEIVIDDEGEELEYWELTIKS